MKENENTRVIFPEGNDDQDNGTDVQDDAVRHKVERLKKPIIFALMGVVFLGCMYLIFKPSFGNKKVEDSGLNDVIPQASEAGLQADKQKAYEQEMLEQKIQGKRNSLRSLSD